MKDYKESWVEEIVEYEIEFLVDSSGGYGFPADENGNVLLDKMNDAAKENYAWCMEHPEKFPYTFNKFRKRTRRYRNPPSGICNCGERIALYNEYLGGCECPKCGQWWNLFGQELKNPEEWSEGDDW